MKSLARIPLILLVCFIGASSLPAQSAAAASYLFSFSEEGVAEIFDPASLARLAEAEVAPGATAVVAAPADAELGRPLKFYVLSADRLTVLSERFEALGTIVLPQPALAGAAALAVSGDGARAVVAARHGAYLIDTSADRIVGRWAADAELSGVLALPDGRRAYLVSADGARLWLGDFASGRVLGTRTPPAPLESWALSADRAAAYGYAAGEMFDLRTMELAGASAPAEVQTKRPATKLMASNRGAFYVEQGERLMAGELAEAGENAAVLEPDGQAFDPTASPWAASADGRSVYIVTKTGVLAKIDQSGVAHATAAPRNRPAALAVVTPQQQATGLLEQASEDNPLAAGGAHVELAVRAADAGGAPQAGVLVFPSLVEPEPAGTDCVSGLTGADGIGVVDCRLGAVSAPTNLRIVISDDRGRSAPAYTVRVTPPIPEEGLVILEGDNQRVSENSDFTLTVRASRDLLPVAGLRLRATADVDNPNTLRCSGATTDANGVAVIPCHAGVVEQLTTFVIEVEDPDGDAVVFTVQVDPAPPEAATFRKISGDEQVVLQGQNLPAPLVVEALEGGQPRANVRLNVSVLSTFGAPPLECPIFATTDANGRASINCRAKNVFGTSRAQIRVSDEMGRSLRDLFNITVVSSLQGGGGGGSNDEALALVTPRDIEGPVGEPLARAIQVRLTRPVGGTLQGVPVYFSSEADVTFSPAVVTTDAEGLASTTVTLGCNPSNFARISVGLTEGEEDLRVDARGLPGQFASLEKIRGDNQSGAPGQELTDNALVAQTVDACGNLVRNANVVWRVRPAYAASLRNVFNVSDGQGRVSALARLGQYGGPFQVEVGAGDIFTAFDLAVNLDAQTLRARSGDGQSASAGQFFSAPLVAQALGTNGFGIAGVDVDFAVVEGSASVEDPRVTSDSGGLAFTRVRINQDGPVRIEARALGQTAIFNLNSGQRPQTSPEMFVNGGSFETGWTPGSLGIIFGEFLSGAEGVVSAEQAPFPTELAGVRVTVNGVAAPILAVANTGEDEQINLQVPFETPPGEATVVIDNNGSQTTVEGVPIRRVQPGIFTYIAEGRQVAAVLHEDSTLITPASPARPGEILQIYFTGGGPVAPSVGTNVGGPTGEGLARVASPVTAQLNGQELEVIGAFYAPQAYTLYQLNARLPADAAAGDGELTLTVDGVASPAATLPVEP